MAKKRKDKEEESFDFKTPKFNREKFIKNEKEKVRITLFSFIFGIAISFVSFGFWILLRGNDFRWELVLLFGIFTAAWLRYFFIKLNFDLNELGRKGMFTAYAIYFFSWLIVLIVLVNPPFYDDEPPKIELASLPSYQEIGGTVKIIAKLTDNVGIDTINFTLYYPNGNSEIITDYSFENNIFTYNFANVNNVMGEFNYELIATDMSGLKTNQNEGKGFFEYNNDTIKLADPSDGEDVKYVTDIIFDLKTDFDRVYYKVDNGPEINITKKENFYETNPIYKGWIIKNNATIKVYAEDIYYFENLDIKFNNTITDSSTYHFNVIEDQQIGTENSPEIILPKPKLVQVPGFELVVFIISMILIVIILRSQKKNNK
jgi:hypothetical protein